MNRSSVRIHTVASALGALTLLVVALSLPTPAWAQVGSVAGVVRNFPGEPVADAQVRLVHAVSGALRGTTTDESGRYAFSGVAPGRYRLEASVRGFQRTTVPVVVEEPRAYEVDVTLDLVMLDRIVVTATRDERAVGTVASAVSVVDQSEIQRAQKQINLSESLVRVPGVRVEDELGTVGRTRIIVRGTGTRANSPAGSGVRGVKVLIDGIPKNNAGGSAQDLLNVDFGAIERIEVLRGPSSALYGNQSGGVVNIITEEGPADPFVTYRQTAGAFGLFREQLKFGGRSGDFGYLIDVFRTDQEGFRVHSSNHSTGFHSKFTYTIDDRSQLTTIASYEQLDQETPGPLTKEQFEENPEQADPVFIENEVRSKVDEFRLGMIYERMLNDTDELSLTGYYIPRHLGPFKQIGVRIPQDFMNRGAAVRYTRGAPIGGLGNRLTVGVDFQDTPITTGVFLTSDGTAAAELEEQGTTWGFYLQEELEIRPELILSLGGRYDRMEFSSRNLARATDRAERTFEEATPKVGLTFLPTPDVSLYASYSRGFEAPILGELRTLPGGEFGFNENLDSQKSTNWEVGARGQLLGRVSFDMAFFRQDVEDLISPIGTFPNNSFQNVGEVDQKGFELASTVVLTPTLAASASYTWSDFVFDRFVTDGTDLSGNELPGVPPQTFFGEIRWSHASGLFAALSAKWADEFFFDNENTAFNDEYTVLGLRLDYTTDVGSVRLAPFLGIENLTDEEYSEFGLINDSRERFYNPLPGTHAYGGVSVTF